MSILCFYSLLGGHIVFPKCKFTILREIKKLKTSDNITRLSYIVTTFADFLILRLPLVKYMFILVLPHFANLPYAYFTLRFELVYLLLHVGGLLQ